MTTAGQARAGVVGALVRSDGRRGHLRDSGSGRMSGQCRSFLLNPAARAQASYASAGVGRSLEGAVTVGAGGLCRMVGRGSLWASGALGTVLAPDEVVASTGLAGLVAGAGRAAPMASLVGELLPTAGPGTGTAATGAVSVGVPAASGGTGTLRGGPITTDVAPPARAAARRPAAGNRFNRHDLAGAAAGGVRYGCWICVGSGSSGLAAARRRVSARLGSSAFVAGALVASVLDSVNRSAS